MYAHKLKYRSLESGFPLKSQELSAFDSVKEDLLDFHQKHRCGFLQSGNKISVLPLSSGPMHRCHL